MMRSCSIEGALHSHSSALNALLFILEGALHSHDSALYAI